MAQTEGVPRTVVFDVGAMVAVVRAEEARQRQGMAAFLSDLRDRVAPDPTVGMAVTDGDDPPARAPYFRTPEEARAMGERLAVFLWPDRPLTPVADDDYTSNYLTRPKAGGTDVL